MIAVFAFSCATAQIMPLTNEAARLCQNKEFEEALLKIDEAKRDAAEAADSYMWYVDGFIHKEIYKVSESGMRDSKHRELAVESFLKSLELDKKNENVSMTRLSLKFLASTYFNEALVQTREFDNSSESEPEKTYAKFRRLMHFAEPGTSLKKYDIEFRKNMGQRYFVLWQGDIDNDYNADKSVDYYADVVRIDSTANEAYYNIAVVYYNQAVFKYRKLGPDTDIFDLVVIQQECAELIKNKALPNMDKAYKLNPEKPEVVRGLMFIHRALEHENDVEYFKSEMERLIREGKVTLPEK
jgi:hypothetical protein